jgi:hypothetical protein
VFCGTLISYPWDLGGVKTCTIGVVWVEGLGWEGFFRGNIFSCSVDFYMLELQLERRFPAHYTRAVQNRKHSPSLPLALEPGTVPWYFVSHLNAPLTITPHWCCIYPCPDLVPYDEDGRVRIHPYSWVAGKVFKMSRFFDDD